MSDRIDDLERRVAAVEELLAEQQGTAGKPGSSDAPGVEGGPLWALDGFRRRIGDTDSGGVMFMGIFRPTPPSDPEKAEQDSAPTPAGRPAIEWQYGRPADYLLDQDWANAAPALAALGHPVRVDLLRRVLNGTTATKDLVETEGLGTSGQLHHHLRTLVSAGWLRQRTRGDYEVPGPRVIPLLAILTAVLE
ncbi:ArsR family transcriptional regulator [Ammonicoccus fulvus]|uniref:ArsR family transcriptional regulator n=1 Tax=Ammonicoccus fulvus TaxID=3138240 RepID=A0ABZ3FJI5_9ACTN